MRYRAFDRAGSARLLDIDIAQPIGSGGEGAIYVDQTQPDRVVKLFINPTFEREQKVAAMIQAPPPHVIERFDKGRPLVRFAWPIEVIRTEQGVFAGFTMPRIDTAQSIGLERFFLARERQRLRNRDDYPFRLSIAINIAQVLHDLHRVGHACIDLKPQNILIDTSQGFISLVDCDSFRITTASQMFPAAVATAEYLAPEFHGNPQSANHAQDLFAAALLFFRLLNNDIAPTTGIVDRSNAPSDAPGRIREGLLLPNSLAEMRPIPTDIHQLLPDDTLALFCRAFSAAGSRPSLLQWRDHLRELLSNRLSPCRIDRSHFALPKGCPDCFLAGALQVAAPKLGPIPNKTRPTSNTKVPSSPPARKPQSSIVATKRAGWGARVIFSALPFIIGAFLVYFATLITPAIFNDFNNPAFWQKIEERYSTALLTEDNSPFIRRVYYAGYILFLLAPALLLSISSAICICGVSQSSKIVGMLKYLTTYILMIIFCVALMIALNTALIPDASGTKISIEQLVNSYWLVDLSRFTTETNAVFRGIILYIYCAIVVMSWFFSGYIVVMSLWGVFSESASDEVFKHMPLWLRPR